MDGRRDTLVLGIDTSLRSTGVGIVRAAGNSLSVVDHGTVKTKAKARLSECLRNLTEGIHDIIDRHNPDEVAIEGIFFPKNIKTAMILGEARGVAIAACATRKLSVYEYAPRKVKQAVVGFGSAGKPQVRAMVMSLLSMTEEPQEDAGDALAIAICHLHNRTGCAALMPKEI